MATSGNGNIYNELNEVTSKNITSQQFVNSAFNNDDDTTHVYQTLARPANNLQTRALDGATSRDILIQSLALDFATHNILQYRTFVRIKCLTIIILINTILLLMVIVGTLFYLLHVSRASFLSLAKEDIPIGIDYCVSLPCLNNAHCKSDGRSYLCWCPLGYYGINCQFDIHNVKTVAFFASSQRNNLSNNAANRPNYLIRYGNLSFNQGFSFDFIRKTQFTVPEDGIYWFQLSVGVPFNELCNVTLINKSGYALTSINRVGTQGNFMDTLSSSVLVQLQVSQELRIISEYDIYSDWLNQVTWVGFRIDSIMQPLVAFAVTAQSHMAGQSAATFTNVSIDTHNALQLNYDSYFVVPVSGIYYFSYRIDSIGSEEHDLYLCVNMMAYASLHSTVANGTETTSRSVIMELNHNDRVHLHLHTPDKQYSTENRQIFFAGFLYQPATFWSRVIWSVYMSESQLGYRFPLAFGTIDVNEGDGWQANENRFVVPQEGVYYVQLISLICPDRIFSGVRLLLNGVAVTGMRQPISFQKGYNTRSREALLRLATGDVLLVMQLADCGYCQYGERATSFSGMKLFS